MLLMAPRVLIVDDHDGFRRHARRMLEAEGFTVVGEAVDGAGGISAAGELHPDVVLLDVHLPDTTGFAVAGELTRGPDAPAVVMTSTRDPDEIGERAVDYGARGFISKAELSGAAIDALLG